MAERASSYSSVNYCNSDINMLRRAVQKLPLDAVLEMALYIPKNERRKLDRAILGRVVDYRNAVACGEISQEEAERISSTFYRYAATFRRKSKGLSSK